MRLVIAYDLSADAELAIAAVAGAAWPPGTTVRITTSRAGIGEAVSSFAGADELRDHARTVEVTIEDAQARAAATLTERGLEVATSIVAGPPGRAVVADAEAFGADVVVAGARSQSMLTRTLLGSVSTEISERARCPVLIVRSPTLRRVLLATDGSEACEAAVATVVDWPAFDGAEVRIVAVAPRPVRYTDLVAPDRPEGGADDDLAISGGQALHSLDDALGRLAGAGRRAEAQVRIGDPATEIIDAAREWAADVVVVGSTGTSIVRRLVVGSVARAVLHGVSSSVLMVPPRTR